MKKAFRFFILCIWLVPNSLGATHILGGSMGYYYKNGQLLVEMILYRDCGNSGSAQFDGNASIAVYKPNGELFLSLQAVLDSVETLDIENLSCNALDFGCVERGYYTFPLSLPADTNNYMVVYQRCCRPSDITNLVNPGEVGNTVNVEITAIARSIQNSSPRWLNTPRFNICPHQAAVLNLGATEPDGDFVLYSFCQPQSGGGNITAAPDLFGCEGALPTPPCPPPFESVPFAVPSYTFNNPLGSDTSVLNLITGDWYVTPNFTGKFNYGVCVMEYNNGLLLSTAQLDLTVWVKDVLGTSESGGFATLNCSPNPASDVVNLSTEMFEGASAQIELIDLAGKIWFSEKRSNVASKEHLNLTALPQGIYIARILTEGKTATGRLAHF